MLRDTEPRVHALVCFIHGGGTGVWLGFKTHLAPWALCPILRHAVGNVKPLLNIRSPPSASVFPLRWLPDSQGQGHTGGGEREGWRLPVYRKQDTKALLFRIFLCTLWGSSFVHPPHTLPHFFMCCFFSHSFHHVVTFTWEVRTHSGVRRGRWRGQLFPASHGARDGRLSSKPYPGTWDRAFTLLEPNADWSKDRGVCITSEKMITLKENDSEALGQKERLPTPLAFQVLAGGPGKVTSPLSAVGKNKNYCCGFWWGLNEWIPKNRAWSMVNAQQLSCRSGLLVLGSQRGSATAAHNQRKKRAEIRRWQIRRHTLLFVTWKSSFQDCSLGSRSSCVIISC